MLVLSRKEKQSIVINEHIEIIVQEISGEHVKLAIVAPKEVKIYRKELIEESKATNSEALKSIDKDVMKTYFTNIQKGE